MVRTIEPIGQHHVPERKLEGRHSPGEELEVGLGQGGARPTTVADLTGAPARSYRDRVAAHADSFRNAAGQG